MEYMTPSEATSGVIFLECKSYHMCIIKKPKALKATQADPKTRKPTSSD